MIVYNSERLERYSPATFSSFQGTHSKRTGIAILVLAIATFEQRVSLPLWYSVPLVAGALMGFSVPLVEVRSSAYIRGSVTAYSPKSPCILSSDENLAPDGHLCTSSRQD